MENNNIIKVKSYIEQSERFMQEGWEQLKKKDLTQASEKFWGAAAQITKAYGEFFGYRHNGHAFLFQIVDKISKETKDEELKDQFGLAGILHINFYENWLTEDQVKRYSYQVQKFIEKIKKLIKEKEKLNSSS